MKKKIFIIMTILFCTTSVFAAIPELKFQSSDTETEVQNFNENNKIICNDNVRFLNSTKSKISFEVYGKQESNSDKVFLCSVTVKPNDTQSESCKRDLENFKYVYAVCINGNVTYSKVTCEHNDMYFYISDFQEAETSQDKELTGFWGIEWKTSRGEAKKIISNKGDYVLTEDAADGIAYKGKFGGVDATIVLYFFENQFYRGVVAYPYEENRAFSRYQTTKEQIIKKYGPPTKVAEVFQKPYYKGDGYEEQAIRLNKGLYMSSWSFSNNNTIYVAISNSLDTLLCYENNELTEKNKTIEDQKNMDDF